MDTEQIVKHHAYGRKINMKITLLVMSAALAILNPLESPGAELTSLSSGKNEVQIEHDGQSRRLIVTTPQTYSRKNSYAVLFCFHGAGGKAEGQSARWSPQADKKGLIVISAEAVQSLRKWNFKDNFHEQEIDDVGFISKVVEVLIENKIADKNAIYATGHSSGGLFSWRLAKETDLFAAVAPMSCGMAKGAHDPDEETKPIPVFQVIGDKDKQCDLHVDFPAIGMMFDDLFRVHCRAILTRRFHPDAQPTPHSLASARVASHPREPNPTGPDSSVFDLQRMTLTCGREKRFPACYGCFPRARTTTSFRKLL